MDTVCIAQIAAYEGREVELRGWLYNKRSSGKLHFLQIRDGTGIMQCVAFRDDLGPELFDQCDHLGQESSMVLRGLVRREPRAPAGFEMSVREVQIIQAAEGYPISPKEHGVSFLMDQRHLWLRSTRPHAVLKVRGEVLKACRDYMERGGFMLVDAPIFTPAACEGTSTLFETDYFEQKAYLTQSGQLYMEAAAMAFGKVYCLGPTFRAEKSKTRRHLTEFWMIEPEMAFYELTDNMDLAEAFLKRIISDALKFCMEDLKFFAEKLDNNKELFTKLENVLNNPFKRVSYTEGVDILLKSGKAWEYPVSWGVDLQSEHERYLAEQHFKCPVILYDYPRTLKPFYMKVNDDGKTVRAMDVLVPGVGEIIGGSQREERLDVLESRMKEQHLEPEAYSWYLDLRRYGTVPHSGFGLGLERTILFLSGMANIRDVIPFPRTPGNAEY